MATSRHDSPRHRGSSDPRTEQDMVHWYDPRQLLVTGLRVVLSYLLRERVDRRVMDAFAGHQRIFDYSQCVGENEDFWLDYVADVGDGYDSTYEVARQLARPELSEIVTDDGSPLPRGSVLIMGGDQVYPAASREEYDNRLRLPYERAFPWTAESDAAPDPARMPDRELGLGALPGRALYNKVMSSECTDEHRYPGLFALPGNHDWYDGLACFTRLFCQERTIGGLRTYQNRSYFALELPHDWWLLAIDVQLTDYIDKPQRDYFTRVIDRMNDDDKVILCMSTPSWEPDEGFELLTKSDFWSSRDSHVFLEQRIFKKAQIRMWLSGDFHYYRRYECHCEDEKRASGQMITCGGGGAFLHPTHTRRKSYRATIAGQSTEIVEQITYPDRSESRTLAWKNAWRLLNPREAYGAGLVTSLMYLVLGWYAVPGFASLAAGIAEDRIVQGFIDFALTSLLNPLALFWLSVFLALCYSATPDQYKRWSRLASASAHMLAHLVTIAALAILGIYLIPVIADWIAPQLTRTRGEELELLALGVVAVGGFLLGKLVLAGYLLLAVTFANVQGNNAFAMLRIPDYKCFLRMRIGSDGLEVYAIRIDKVGRHKGCDKAPSARDKVGLIERFKISTDTDGGVALSSKSNTTSK